MLIRVGHELTFELADIVPMTLLLHLHSTREADIKATRFKADPAINIREHRDGLGNRCTRVLAPAGRVKFYGDTVLEDSGLQDEVNPDARQVNVDELPDECLQYLLNSRYCEVDKLVPVAWELFGQTEPGWARVQAICAWVHNHVTFGYNFARPTKSALDVFVERVGVCRDFSHLALTFCRCMNIPARYTTGYLGDFGVAPNPNPMDFSGWFEAYLGGKWYTFDARHNQRRIGRVVMAYGRDATDVALTTSYGRAPLVGFKVWACEVESPHLPEEST